MLKSVFFTTVAISFIAMSLSQETTYVPQEQQPQPQPKPPQEQLPQPPPVSIETAAAVEPDYKWDNLADPCLVALHKQINDEFNAAIVYLTMAAYFRHYTVNLLGFSDFFFKAAAEERQHGIGLMEYALMRGKTPVDKSSFSLDYTFKVPAGTDGEGGLRLALAREEKVTQSIRGVINACETHGDDYNLADFLADVYLGEQHKGQRELAEKIATLQKMKKTAPSLGEYLFDKTHI